MAEIWQGQARRRIEFRRLLQLRAVARHRRGTAVQGQGFPADGCHCSDLLNSQKNGPAKSGAKGLITQVVITLKGLKQGGGLEILQSLQSRPEATPYAASTVTRLAGTTGCFGIETSSTPWANFALMLSPCTFSGSAKRRVKLPDTRSMRS